MLALALATGPALACPLPGTPLQSGAVQLSWQAAPAVAVGQHFSLHLQLCPADAVLARVDATMPEHRHGMNYRPTLTALGAGRWRADGLMFHMAGRWELRFDVQSAGQSVTLRDPVSVP